MRASKVIDIVIVVIVVVAAFLYFVPLEFTSADIIIAGLEYGYNVQSRENIIIAAGAHHIGKPVDYPGGLCYLSITKADNENYLIYLDPLIPGWISTGWHLEQGWEWTFKVVEGEQLWYWMGEDWVQLEWVENPVVFGEYAVKLNVLGDDYTFYFKVV